jgi:hypothetical protein
MVALFHLGLVLGLVHLALSLELGLTLAAQGALVRTVLLFIYPLALAGLGMGAALDTRLAPDRDPSLTLRGAGAALLAFLGVSHASGFMGIETGAIGAPEYSLLAILLNPSLVLPGLLFLGSLGLFYGLVGISIAPFIRSLKSEGEKAVGWGWGVHLCGLVVGYLGVDFLITNLGPGCVLLGCGLSLLITPRHALVPLVVLLLGFHGLGVQNRLEDMRNLEDVARSVRRVNQVRRHEQGLTDRRDAHMGSLQTLEKAVREPLAMGWSRHAQVRLIEGPGNFDAMGLYNFRLQWGIRADIEEEEEKRRTVTYLLRKKTYKLFDPLDSVVLVGTGGGHGLSSFSFPLHAGITAVEMDPTVVRILRDEHPAWNGNVYRTVTVVASDGRTFLERHPGGLDGIVLESARFRSPSSLLPATTALYLYSREAIHTYIDRLAPDGLLMLQFNGVEVGESVALPRQVMRSLVEKGAPNVALYAETMGVLNIFGTPPGQDVWERIADLDTVEMRRWSGAPLGSVLAEGRRRDHKSSVMARGEYQLTDDTPFWVWANFSKRQRTHLTTLVLLGLLGSTLPVVVLGLRGRNKGTWNPIPFSFVLGVAHSTTYICTFFLARSYFGDSVLTVLGFLVLLLFWGAVGSVVSMSIPPRLLTVRARVLGTGLLLCLHFVWVGLLPFELGGTVLRWLAAGLAVAPGGVAMGLFFPLVLMRSKPSQVGSILLSDALGALAGYCLIYLVCLPYGLTVQAGFSVGIYLLAAWLLEGEEALSKAAT